MPTTLVSENLRATLELFGPNGEHWTNHHGLMGRKYLEFRPLDEKGTVCYCAVGGVNMVRTGGPYKAFTKLNSGAYSLTPETEVLFNAIPKNDRSGYTMAVDAWPVVCYNDNPARTWPEVKAWFERAIEMEEA